jgi:hypothetical protein
VKKDGNTEVAVGPQPKDALLFVPSAKSLSQRIREQREKAAENSKFIRTRIEAATKRAK